MFFNFSIRIIEEKFLFLSPWTAVKYIVCVSIIKDCKFDIVGERFFIDCAELWRNTICTGLLKIIKVWGRLFRLFLIRTTQTFTLPYAYSFACTSPIAILFYTKRILWETITFSDFTCNDYLCSSRIISYFFEIQYTKSVLFVHFLLSPRFFLRNICNPIYVLYTFLTRCSYKIQSYKHLMDTRK